MSEWVGKGQTIHHTRSNGKYHIRRQLGMDWTFTEPERWYVIRDARITSCVHAGPFTDVSHAQTWVLVKLVAEGLI